MSFHDSDYREIITKAVCGSGRRKVTTTNYATPSHKPASILGCWVINHKYHAKKKAAQTVEVYGSYDVNIWYSYEDNTRTEVVKETIDYCDKIELTSQDMHCLHHDDEVAVKVIQQPNCIQCKIEKDRNDITVEIEKEFEVKIIGETKVNVRVGTVHHHEGKGR